MSVSPRRTPLRGPIRSAHAATWPSVSSSSSSRAAAREDRASAANANASPIENPHDADVGELGDRGHPSQPEDVDRPAHDGMPRQCWHAAVLAMRSCRGLGGRRGARIWQARPRRSVPVETRARSLRIPEPESIRFVFGFISVSFCSVLSESVVRRQLDETPRHGVETLPRHRTETLSAPRSGQPADIGVLVTVLSPAPIGVGYV
jgi:hypothetical protein